MTDDYRLNVDKYYGVLWKFYEDKYITVNGIRTRYWETGQGEKTIVMLHGFSGSVEEWSSSIVALESKYRIFAPDLPGHGRTEKPDIAYDYSLLTSFLKAFLEAMNIPRAILFGHSMGGLTATYFAIEYADRVEKLVLVSPAAGMRFFLGFRILSLPGVGERLLKPPKSTKEILKTAQINSYRFIQWPERLLQRLYEFYHSDGYTRAALRFIRSVVGLWGSNRRGWAEFSAYLPRFSTIRQRTLLVWGNQDIIVPAQAARYYRERLERLEFWPVDRCGHSAHFEYPLEFNERVAAFLRQEP